MSAAFVPGFLGEYRGIRPQKVMPLPEKGTSAVVCVPRRRVRRLFAFGATGEIGERSPAARMCSRTLLFRSAGASFSKSCAECPRTSARHTARAALSALSSAPSARRRGENAASGSSRGNVGGSPAPEIRLPVVSDAGAEGCCFCGPTRDVVAAATAQAEEDKDGPRWRARAKPRGVRLRRRSALRLHVGLPFRPRPAFVATPYPCATAAGANDGGSVQHSSPAMRRSSASRDLASSGRHSVKVSLLRISLDT